MTAAELEQGALLICEVSQCRLAQEVLDKARAEERETCARVIEDACIEGYKPAIRAVLMALAGRIRARGDK